MKNNTSIVLPSANQSSNTSTATNTTTTTNTSTTDNTGKTISTTGNSTGTNNTTSSTSHNQICVQTSYAYLKSFFIVIGSIILFLNG
jgi:hypothetical protein